MAGTRMVAIEISREKIMNLRYILDIDTKGLTEKLMGLMKDSERTGELSFLTCSL